MKIGKYSEIDVINLIVLILSVLGLIIAIYTAFFAKDFRKDSGLSSFFNASNIDDRLLVVESGNKFQDSSITFLRKSTIY